MNDSAREAIRRALDAITARPASATAETWFSVTLESMGFHVIPGADLPVTAWNEDKPHRCPRCHAVAIDMERPRPWRVYECCRCAARFTRWPRLAPVLPSAGVMCPGHEAITAALGGKETDGG